MPMKLKRIKRPVVRIDTRPQMPLFDGDRDVMPVRGATTVSGPVRFVEPDPREIRFGALGLDEHLKQMGVTDALVVRELLARCDWSAFEARYAPDGRPSYAPRLMTGIVLFGLRRGVSSLRELERFARTDLGCMWVSGGITPDHSVLGRFIQRHEAELSRELFAAVVDEALKRTGSNRDRLAGDGTTLEAMSSRFALMKREALAQWRERLGQSGGDGAEAERAQVDQLCAVLAEREQAKAIVPAEPEAGLLRLKNGRGSRPAYEALVLANKARVVVDAQVHSTSEIAPMKELLERLDGEQTQELLLDAGFANDFELIERTVAQEISLLCPERAETTQGKEPRLIPLREFRYDEERDGYVCPEGKWLRATNRCAGNAAEGRRPYVRYTASALDCGGCVRRATCTDAKVRSIQRTQGQEYKEALRVVMAQPRAKRIFAQRKAMVEPVFSVLRERQGLHRFRRKGLAGVRLELRLHLIAYNISRAVAYAQRRAGRGIFGLIQQLLGLASAIVGDAQRIGSVAKRMIPGLRYSPRPRLIPAQAV